ncbi:MAG: NAD-dependent epimerase/dehydratase family protein [Candidatus Nanoarchaeia archaeon]|nr:NAD-dependent epimerase/dehydratase family protein [Candidatus Nanoarchaeia archaeon]
MKILVTGASGMIGTCLCENLLSKNFEVIGMDIKHNKFSKEVDNITKIIDLRDFESTLSAFSGNIDIVIHLAANARVYDLIKDPELSKDNLITTFNVLEACRLKNINKIIFSSSREVYGNSSKECLEQNVDISNCENTYSASKISNEVFIRSYQKSYGINYIILRLSNVYGRYDLSDRVIPLFIKKIKNKENITIYGGKSKYLDFIFIEDVADVIINSISNFKNYENLTFNVANNEKVPIFELSKLLQELMDKKVEIYFEENRTGETMNYCPNSDKIKKIMKWTPKVNLKEGLKKSIEWYQKY